MWAVPTRQRLACAPLRDAAAVPTPARLRAVPALPPAVAAVLLLTLAGCERTTRAETPAPASAPGPAPVYSGDFLNARFDAWFTAPGHYEQVSQAVMQNGFCSTRNACVAFEVTAWRLSGLLEVPRTTTTLQNIRIQTVPFSAWLMQDQGWTCLTDAAALQPGDVVFAASHPTHRAINPSAPPETSHVYLFHVWLDRARGVAQVMDNQASGLHRRNIVVIADPLDEWEEKDPMLFFLRHP